MTNFFRDPDAFSTFETEVIAPLIQAKDADAPLRVWIPGCATGEEPYSVAMLLLEHQTAAQNPCRLQIFATDVDERALEVARRGIYPEGISADVSPERLARFFTRADESGWQISKQVRETVTFAVQNVITDAPFSKMDVISCRNILIYLEPEMQNKIITLLHFALKEGGYLFLGPSDTVGRRADLFEPVSKKWRIYRRIGPGRADDLQFPAMQTEPRHAKPQPATRPQAPHAGDIRQIRIEELSTVNNQFQDKVEEMESASNDMANLLNATHIATVFLDAGLRIKLFTPTAARAFNLIATDRGRPIGDLVTRFTDDDLLREARQLMRDLTPREKEVRTEDGRWCIRRMMPYRTSDNRIDGVVITYVDITERKQAADAVVQRLAAVVESSVDAIFSKDLDGTIRTWNQGAERLYGYSRDEAIGRSVKMLVPEDRIDEWTKVMAMLARGEHVEQFETERLRKDGQRRAVALTVSPIRDSDGKVVSASVTGRDITDRKRADEELRRIEERYRQMADQARDREARLLAILSTAVDAIITIDVHGAIQSVNATAEQMFGYGAAEMIGQNVKMLMPAPYRDEHDGYLARYLQTGEKHVIGIGREVEGLRKDGSTFPLDLAVSEVGHLQLFTALLRDISRRKELEREVVEIASLERRRIGQDLHDSVSQELTALSMLAGDLAETLRSDPSHASQLVERLVLGLQRGQQELRAVMRGLFPVSVDDGGLMAALSDLASRTQQKNKVTCVFECPKPVLVKDNLIATHLYLIAQEAVHNAVKHAGCNNIRIAVESNRLLVLRVQDDGIGIRGQPVESHGGLGLRIMRNRAAIIRATLTIESAKPAGTLVTCALARKNHEP